MKTADMEAERLQVIADRKAAFQAFVHAAPARRLWIHSEFILPLNERLNQINRRLSVEGRGE